MTTTRILFIHALSPLHAGTGQGTGVIDLPIAREKATGIPYLPGSSVKGTLRDGSEGLLDWYDRLALFGPDTKYASDNAGSAQFADQRLLLLPVRSLAGTFAWITSPYVLQRFKREALDAGLINIPDAPRIERGSGEEEYQQCAVASGTRLYVANQRVVLEDLDLVARETAEATKWAEWIGQHLFSDPQEQDMLVERLCIVHDDVLSFLLTTALEVVARIKLNDATKTVDTNIGGLWYEEALPAETVLTGLVVAAPVDAKRRNKNGQDETSNGNGTTIRLSADQIFTAVGTISQTTLQFGGKATVGRGLCRMALINTVASTTEASDANP